MASSERPEAQAVPEADMRHAVDHHLCQRTLDEEGPPWRALYVGPDRAGALIEVVVIERDDGSELAIHARRMRRTYGQLLRQEARDG